MTITQLSHQVSLDFLAQMILNCGLWLILYITVLATRNRNG